MDRLSRQDFSRLIGALLGVSMGAALALAAACLIFPAPAEGFATSRYGVLEWVKSQGRHEEREMAFFFLTLAFGGALGWLGATRYFGGRRPALLFPDLPCSPRSGGQPGHWRRDDLGSPGCGGLCGVGDRRCGGGHLVPQATCRRCPTGCRTGEWPGRARIASFAEAHDDQPVRRGGHLCRGHGGICHTDRGDKHRGLHRLRHAHGVVHDRSGDLFVRQESGSGHRLFHPVQRRYAVALLVLPGADRDRNHGERRMVRRRGNPGLPALPAFFPELVSAKLAMGACRRAGLPHVAVRDVEPALCAVEHLGALSAFDHLRHLVRSLGSTRLCLASDAASGGGSRQRDFPEYRDRHLHLCRRCDRRRHHGTGLCRRGGQDGRSRRSDAGSLPGLERDRLRPGRPANPVPGAPAGAAHALYRWPHRLADRMARRLPLDLQHRLAGHSAGQRRLGRSLGSAGKAAVFATPSRRPCDGGAGWSGS